MTKVANTTGAGARHDVMKPWMLTLLTMHSRVYYVQSKILYIPDRYGLFSSGSSIFSFGSPLQQEGELLRLVCLLSLLLYGIVLTPLWVFGVVELGTLVYYFSHYCLTVVVDWAAEPYIRRWFDRKRRSCEIQEEKEVQGENGISPPTHSTV
ncbi:hypothetical protein FPOAC2_06992 [Fusarium poae]